MQSDWLESLSVEVCGTFFFLKPPLALDYNEKSTLNKLNFVTELYMIWLTVLWFGLRMASQL